MLTSVVEVLLWDKPGWQAILEKIVDANWGSTTDKLV